MRIPSSTYLTQFRWAVLIEGDFPSMLTYLEDLNTTCRSVSEYGCKRFDQATILLMKVCNEKA